MPPPKYQLLRIGIATGKTDPANNTRNQSVNQSLREYTPPNKIYEYLFFKKNELNLNKKNTAKIGVI